MADYMNKLPKIWFVYGTTLALRTLVCSAVVPSHQGEICRIQQRLQQTAGQGRRRCWEHQEGRDLSAQLGKPKLVFAPRGKIGVRGL